MRRNLQNSACFEKSYMREHRIQQKEISYEKSRVKNSCETSFINSQRSNSFQRQSYQACTSMIKKSGSLSGLKVQPRNILKKADIYTCKNTESNYIINRYLTSNNNQSQIKKKPILLYHKSNHHQSNPSFYLPHDIQKNVQTKTEIPIRALLQNSQEQTKSLFDKNIAVQNQMTHRMQPLIENIKFGLNTLQEKQNVPKLNLKSVPIVQSEDLLLTKKTNEGSKEAAQQNQKKSQISQNLKKWKQYAVIQPFKGLFLCKYCLQYFATVQQANHFKNCRPPFWKEAYKQKFIKLSTLIDRIVQQAQKKMNVFAVSDQKLSILFVRMQDLLRSKSVKFEDSQGVFCVKKLLKTGSLDRDDLFWLLQRLIRGMDGLVLRSQDESKSILNIWKFCG